eukprot:10193231-Alexandrium_andersonii.AAC.1
MCTGSSLRSAQGRLHRHLAIKAVCADTCSPIGVFCVCVGVLPHSVADFWGHWYGSSLVAGCRC